jgi:pseudo-rSAM protein
MKKNKLVLFPDTFLWVKGKSGIIYNSKNYRYFTFYCNENIRNFCDILLDLDNLYSVEIPEYLLKDEQVEKWLHHIIDIEAGSHYIQDKSNDKIISYYPLLKIQDNEKHIIWEDKKGIGGGIIQNLNELIFYINESRYGSNQFYKQMYYPLKSEGSIDFEKIEAFIKSCRNGSISRITFIGDILKYRNIDRLERWIQKYQNTVQLVLIFDDVKTEIRKLEKLFRPNVSVTIIINSFKSNQHQFGDFENVSDKLNWLFPVFSMNHFEQVCSIIKGKNLQNVEFIPLYDGHNIDFFKENIYTSIDEFKSLELSKRQVFINMALNINYFGRFTVFPEGKVYANVNNDPIGDINTPIYNMVFGEMTNGNSWLRIRDYEPCNNCVFQWLCPAPGNYEQILDKPNMCNIVNDEKPISMVDMKN